MIESVSMADGRSIPEELMTEVLETAEAKTFEVSWQPGDIVMLDNQRFLHGRRGWNEGDARDIVQIQTERLTRRL